MSFNWAGSAWADIAAELKRRDVLRRLSKDSQLICGGCGKKPSRHDLCFYPANGLGKDNKIIGHQDCVNSTAARSTAKNNGARVAAHQTTNAEILRRKLQDRIPSPETLPPNTVTDVRLKYADTKESLKEIRQNVYQKGYVAGYDEAWKEITAILEESP